MRIVPALAAIALAGTATAASAADWRRAAKNPEGAVFVDASSIQRSGRNVTFRLWLMYRSVSRRGVDNATAVRRADCEDYSFTDLERTYMYVEQVLGTSGEQPSETARPRTMNYFTIRYACVGPETGPDPTYANPYQATRDEAFWTH